MGRISVILQGEENEGAHMYVTDTLHQPSADCEAPDSMERTHSSETAHQHILTQRPREAPDIELFNVKKKKKKY